MVQFKNNKLIFNSQKHFFISWGQRYVAKAFKAVAKYLRVPVKGLINDSLLAILLPCRAVIIDSSPAMSISESPNALMGAS